MRAAVDRTDSGLPPPRALRPLSRRFFARPSPEVARDLIGRLLVGRDEEGGPLVARLVETEAYQEDDPASHSFIGPTDRNRTMFGPAGHLYVYFTYGMHFCMNVVTGPAGHGSAVLLRAAEPLVGIDAMASRRGIDPGRAWLLCSGPARLAAAFGVDRRLDGLDLAAGGALTVAAGRPVPGDLVEAGPRVGIRRGRERPWRFLESGSPYVSPGRRPPAAAVTRRVPPRRSA